MIGIYIFMVLFYSISLLTIIGIAVTLWKFRKL